LQPSRRYLTGRLHRRRHRLGGRVEAVVLVVDGLRIEQRVRAFVQG
jgi:hypothetical protein